MLNVVEMKTISNHTNRAIKDVHVSTTIPSYMYILNSYY